MTSPFRGVDVMQITTDPNLIKQFDAYYRQVCKEYIEDPESAGNHRLAKKTLEFLNGPKDKYQWMHDASFMSLRMEGEPSFWKFLRQEGNEDVRKEFQGTIRFTEILFRALTTCRSLREGDKEALLDLQYQLDQKTFTRPVIEMDRHFRDSVRAGLGEDDPALAGKQASDAVKKQKADGKNLQPEQASNLDHKRRRFIDCTVKALSLLTEKMGRLEDQILREAKTGMEALGIVRFRLLLRLIDFCLTGEGSYESPEFLRRDPGSFGNDPDHQICLADNDIGQGEKEGKTTDGGKGWVKIKYEDGEEEIVQNSSFNEHFKPGETMLGRNDDAALAQEVSKATIEE